MVETNITRRRVMQGVGAAGVATMAGAPVIAAQEGEDGAVGEDATAIRVAHASPDTPNVQVFVEEAGAGATGAGDAGGNTTGGNETGGNETGGGEDEEEPLFEGIGYSDVSNYEEVEPGTYQVRIVATENVGLLEGLFEEGEEQVVFEQEVELSEGTTYTAVAYGELSRANLEGATPGADQDTLGQDDNETADVGAGDNETVDGGVGNETTGAGANETTAGANETDGGVAGEDGAAADDGQAGDGGVLVDELAFGEYEYVELPAGDHSLAFMETEATDEGVGAGTDDGVGAGDNETVDQDAGNETVGQDDGNETVGGGTNETAGGEGDDGGDLGDERDEKAFQVALLEDELSVTGTAGAGNETVGDNGDTVGAGNDTVGDGNETVGGNATGDGAAGEDDEGQSRIRVFHAVPDVDTLQVAALGGTEDDQGAGGEDNVTVDDGAGNDTGGAGAGDDGGVGDDGAAGGDDGAGGAGVAGGDEDSVQVTQFSTEDGTVYSGFAVGYFDPESAGQGDGGADGGNVTAGGGDNATAGGDDNATAGEDDGEDDDITEDPEGREFEFVTVEDAQDGERADGGTGGGLLSLTASAPSASD